VVTPIGDGSLIHVVVTLDNSVLGTTLINYWRDGEIRTPLAASFVGNLRDVNDVNNWLGRSNWAGDANLAGTFDEFRVYDGVLNEAAVQANMTAGPNVPPGPPATSNFVIVSATRDQATGAVTLVWTSEPGKNYVIQQAAALAGWTDLPGTIPSAGATTSTVITPPAGTAATYYRVKLP
jgi:hypothetical protein